MGADELCWLSAIEIQRRVRNDSLSPLDIVEAMLERITAVDGQVGAYVTVIADEARAAARAQADRQARGEALGPLAGVPVSLKDLTPCQGVRCTFGSRLARDFVAPFDDFLVVSLREADAVLIGKTNTPELGARVTTDNQLVPPTRNPWSPSRTAGGSSGGAAAALAAGMCTLAEGSDAAGSIRIPAACCGVVGLKPSRGRISMGPALGEAWSGFAVHGPMARSVADVAMMLDVMAGYRVGDPYSAPPPAEPFAAAARRRPRRLRLVLALDAPGVATEEEVAAAVEAAAGRLEALGHSVTTAIPPVDGMADDYHLVFKAGIAGLPLEVVSGDAPDEDLLSDWVRWLRNEGRRIGASEYVKAQARLSTRSRALVAFFEAFDALLTPTLACPAQPLDWDPGPFETALPEGWFRWLPFTYPFNVTGQPALSVPCGFTRRGLPIGLQIVGRPGDEATILALGAAYEEAAPWCERRPPP